MATEEIVAWAACTWDSLCPFPTLPIPWVRIWGTCVGGVGGSQESVCVLACLFPGTVALTAGTGHGGGAFLSWANRFPHCAMPHLPLPSPL